MQSLPQLETSTFSGQIFWLFITFIFLYFFISKFFLPKIFNIFFERENYFALLQDKLSSLKDKIQKINSINKEILEKAKLQVSEILKNSKFQKDDIKKNLDIKKDELIQQISIQFSSDIENDFDLNKQNMYDKYIRINKIFSDKFFDSNIKLLTESDKSKIKRNFEKSITLLNKKTF